jgi:hypothetical protein
VTGFLFFSVISVSLGLYFRPHYFIMMLPALALLDGAALEIIGRAWVQRGFSGPVAAWAPTLFFLAALAWPTWQHREFLFASSPAEACWETYGENPFVESLAIAQYIRDHTAPDDRIAVLGSEPQIFFYSHRRSATRHIYMYPLMEDHSFAVDMQKEAMAEIEAAQPKSLVIVAVGGSWLFRPKSEKQILRWANGYHRKDYDLAGLIDVAGPMSTYHWGKDAIGYKPRSQFFLEVYRRKANPP